MCIACLGVFVVCLVVVCAFVVCAWCMLGVCVCVCSGVVVGCACGMFCECELCCSSTVPCFVFVLLW